MRMYWARPLLLVVVIKLAHSEEPELPLCPTNVAFFPQNLPMHCRMPNGNAIDSVPQPLPQPKSQKRSVTFAPSIFQSPAPKPPPLPFPVPPGFPTPIFPPGMAVPPMAALPPPMPWPIPGPPPQKLPVIVMPFYSPDPRKKQVPNDTSDSCSDTSAEDDDTDSSSCSDKDKDGSDGYWKPKKGHFYPPKRGHSHSYRRSGHASRRRSKHRPNLLTPLIQYVTKDGFVIFEKEISKVEAKDWLTSKRSEEDERHVSFKELAALKRDLAENNKIEDTQPVYVKPRAKFISSTQKTTTEKVTTRAPAPLKDFKVLLRGKPSDLNAMSDTDDDDDFIRVVPAATNNKKPSFDDNTVTTSKSPMKPVRLKFKALRDSVAKMNRNLKYEIEDDI